MKEFRIIWNGTFLHCLAGAHRLLVVAISKIVQLLRYMELSRPNGYNRNKISISGLGAFAFISINKNIVYQAVDFLIRLERIKQD
jgi:hypothetical protein